MQNLEIQEKRKLQPHKYSTMAKIGEIVVDAEAKRPYNALMNKVLFSHL